MGLLDEDRMLAAVEVIGRAGATNFEVGYLDDEVPSEMARWWASAKWRGTKVLVEDETGPDVAAEALAFKVIVPGQCVHCGRTITVRRIDDDGTPLIYTISGHPLLDEDAIEETGLDALCVWNRRGRHWLRGCDGGYDRPAGGLNRAQRRRQAKVKRLR
jgi:hypothetical protein